MATAALVAMERSLLGICLADTQLLRTASRDLEINDVVDGRHRIIFEAAIELARAGLVVDAVSVGQDLARKGCLEEAGGADYLADIAGDMGADPRRFAHLLEMLTEAAVRRAVERTVGGELASLAKASESSSEVIGRIRRALIEAERKRTTEELPTLDGAAEEVLAEMERGFLETGTPTGFVKLDYLLQGGIKPTDFIVLAGATGSGKTSFGSQVAMNAAEWAARKPKERGPVLFFSYEMSTKQLMIRLILQSAHGPRKLDNGYRAPNGFVGHDRDIVRELVAKIRALPFRLEDDHAPTVEAIQGAVERAMDRYGAPSLVIVDHIGLLRAPHIKGGNRTAEVGDITRSLKLMAQNLKIPVIALAQLNREVGKREDKRPQLSDLRECLAGDALVLDPLTGVRHPIRDLVDAERITVLALNETTLRFEPASATAVESGVKPVFRLRTRSGREIRASANHPFRTIGGWRRLDELTTGVEIAVPRVRADGAAPHQLAKGLSWRGLSYRVQNKRIGRGDLARVAAVVGDDVLMALAKSDLLWDEVVTIEADGEEETYDLVVAGHHNFVANDIVVHNSGSIEQDANAVLFVHRDTYWADPKERALREAEGVDVSIIVAKNRMGAPGDVEMTWIGPSFSFIQKQEDVERAGLLDPEAQGLPADLAEAPISEVPATPEPDYLSEMPPLGEFAPSAGGRSASSGLEAAPAADPDIDINALFG